MNYQSISIEELVQECAQHSHPDAWAEFIRRFQRLIASVVIKACNEWGDMSPEVIEDLIQETYLKLCANNCSLLARFQPHHPNAFLGYLRVVTANAVYDHFRSATADTRDVKKTEQLDEGTNQAHSQYGNVASADNAIFFSQIDEFLRQRGTGPAEEKERTIFWLYYRQGLTAKEIACIPGMNLTAKGVESTIFRMITFVRRSVVSGRNKERSTGIQGAESF
ncbi:MAG TPA: sigma-70 family RNA polymerase sigma factor [Candidatus Solibacter sp.]|jgi:RNA polymerase sigma-70 factor (ECF subfamily)|nr:sigma-70 family RNA polymerase sigma factor [Candidatus Solibacter sp.]